MIKSLISHLNPQVLNVGLASLDANWNFKNVRSGFSRIYYVSDGEAYVEFEDQDMHLTPGNLYLIPAFTLHGYRCTGAFSHYYIHFYDRHFQHELASDTFGMPFQAEAHYSDVALVQRLCSILSDRTLSDFSPAVYDNVSTLRGIIRSNSQMSVDKAIEAKGIVMQLLARFLNGISNKDERDPRIVRAVGIIDTSYDNVCLDEVIKEVCMSKSNFYRLFTHYMECSPAEYISLRKLEAIKLCLQLTSTSLSEISDRFGFSDSSYLIRFFRKHTGLTPSRYRRMMQQT